MLNSYETDGKHTNGIQVTTKAFHDANPKICLAVRAAHEEANAFIKREPKAAAEIYLKLTNDKKNSADDLVAMITDPDIDYTTSPANLMKHVEFMHKVGRSSTCRRLGRICSSPRRTTSRAVDLTVKKTPRL